MTDKATRILVVGPSWVGDMVMAQSLFITIKQQDPDCIIDVVAPSWSVPILNRMPEVNEAIDLPVSHKQLKLGARYSVGKLLRQKNYDKAIVIPRSFKSALVPFFAKAKQRIGYRGEMRYGLLNDMRLLDKTVLAQTVQRQVALGYSADAPQPPAIPYPKLTIDFPNQQAVVKRLGLVLDKPVIGFMPGAEYGPAKQWPVSYYRELAEELADDDYYVWVFGSDKDKPLGEVIALANDHVWSLCGQTSLVDVIDLTALTSNVVSNDSGLMHVACATDRSVVAIYGSSDPAYTPPLLNKAVILYKKLDCSPCFERTCKYEHYNCLNEISVEEVLTALRG